VNSPESRKWVKTGVEFENDQPNVSTVATDRWSDWSLVPLPGSKATIVMEIANDRSLWVRMLDGNGKTMPLREVTWWADLPEESEVWIGAYVAKPAPHGEKDDLTVHFEDLEIELK
jgi:uncharacterized protein